jgi:5-methylcytosine-specific restriction endonuclease McrA
MNSDFRVTSSVDVRRATTKRASLPKALQVAIFRRDGWLCRWCKRPVIFAPVMKYLEREIRSSGDGRPLAYYHAHWTRDGAPVLDELGAVIDHAAAFSRGGLDTLENLITSCNRCNGRKSGAPLKTWAQRPKRTPVKGKYGEPNHWDGLSMVFVMLARRDPHGLTPGEREWLNEFTAAEASGCQGVTS